MTNLLLRNVDQDVHSRLKELARRNGRSVQAELRALVRAAVLAVPPQSAEPLSVRIRRRFQDLSLEGVFEELRGSEPRSAVFDGDA